ncbi:MAG: FMN-binding negative transcriptional regulator [Formosimonas sp.]
MYIPKAFQETSPDAMRQLIRARPLGSLVTLTDAGLLANHVPFYFHDDGANGVLRAHVARSNPVWQDFAGEVLVLFHDHDAYISPSWYVSKLDDGKVVPTWNYGAVHVRGQMRVVHDAAWIRAQIDALTTQQEGQFAAPWAVTDAPSEFIEPMIARALVGLEITITAMEGKWKVSQNQTERNQNSVVAGLEAHGDVAMAQMVRERCGQN